MPLVTVFLAGVLAVTSPCILPILPVLFGSALQEKKTFPLFVVLGLATSFSIMGAIFGAFGRALAFDRGDLQLVTIGTFLILGITLLSPGLTQFFTSLQSPLERLISRLPVASTRVVFPGQAFILGLLLAVLWAPCAGPVLGAVLILASASGSWWSGFWLLFVFSLGASLPLLTIAHLGQRFLAYRGHFTKYRRQLTQIFGLLLILTALFTLTGTFKKIEKTLAPLAPNWSTTF
jgi:cytochrome c-type biogenesis protein